MRDGTPNWRKHSLVSSTTSWPTGSLSSGVPSAPSPPVLPGALLIFQMLVHDSITDLTAIADVIRSDVGLAAQVFRTAAADGYAFEAVDPRGLDIDSLVVHIGLAKLRELGETATYLSDHPGGAPGVRTYERFQVHARLTALIAEELACETGRVDPEDAYIAGLFRRIGAIPFILGWNGSEFKDADSNEIGSHLARCWHLPPSVREVIRGESASHSEQVRELLKVVNIADAHAFHLQLGFEY
jgi:HD-like signal output (HDOD) protein